MKGILTVGLTCLITWAGWNIGATLSADAIALAMGVIFGTLAGVGVAIIAISTQKQRVDVHHHHEHKISAELQKQPQAMITAQPQKYIVVDNPVQPGAITGAQHGQLEVL